MSDRLRVRRSYARASEPGLSCQKSVVDRRTGKQQVYIGAVAAAIRRAVRLQALSDSAGCLPPARAFGVDGHPSTVTNIVCMLPVISSVGSVATIQ